jgi:glycine/D-amino acid oxidase-like deaminating enzyme
MAQRKVIVVGAGIVGASIAWHLSKAGAPVTIVTDGAPGGIATPATFAWINASWGNPETYFRLRIRAMSEWCRLAGEVPGIPLSWCGGLLWDLPPAELEAYAAQHASWGYGIRAVDRAQAARIEPGLADAPGRAVHVAEEGAVEAVPAVEMLLADARRRGAVLRAARVDGLEMQGDRVVGVRAGGGVLSADDVVLAAGMATPRIAATAGVTVPIDSPPGLIVHSRAHPARLLNGLVLADRLHMRQTAEGRLIAGSDFGGGDPGADPASTAAELFSVMRLMLIRGNELALDFFSVGKRPTPADGFPIVGRAQGRAGLYLAVMHSGVTLAPAVGLFAAEEILAGLRDPLLAPYGPERFLP